MEIGGNPKIERGWRFVCKGKVKVKDAWGRKPWIELFLFHNAGGILNHLVYRH